MVIHNFNNIIESREAILSAENGGAGELTALPLPSSWLADRP